MVMGSGRTKPRLAVHQHESETLGEEGKRNCNGYSCRGQATPDVIWFVRRRKFAAQRVVLLHPDGWQRVIPPTAGYGRR